MIDIDHFKQFNDLHGHQAGDDMLRRVAEILKGYVRSCDVAARYGGEEFLILLTETGPEGALNFAEKLRERVGAIRAQGEQAVTLSVGVATFPDHGADVESVIRQADAALYEGKRRGRNRVALAASGRGSAPALPVSLY
jgi:diguanylate cyclase (GGDEF)-like protein